MKPTDNGRRQHEDIEKLALEIEAHARKSDYDPVLLRRQLARMGGRLLVHSTMEEEALYPRLMTSGKPELEKLATRLLEELQPIYRDVAEFVTRFTLADAIEEDVASFRSELARVLELLRKRLAVETELLYPAADALL